MRQFLVGLMLIGLSGVVVAATPYGQLTPADLMRRDFSQALTPRHELMRNIVRTNEEFVAARKELDATAPGTPAYAKAQEKLRTLELSKDLSLLFAYLRRVSATPGSQELELANVPDDLTATGSIPQSARPAFESWVRSVQSALGTDDVEPLLLNDSPQTRQRLIDALQKSHEAYEEYQQAAQKARR